MRFRSLLLASASVLMVGPARAFALEAVRDSIDDLPEDIKAEYTQQGDKFVLQVTGMKSNDDFTRVQNALNKERQDHSALKARIKENFGEEKFEDIHAKLDRIPELEAAAGDKIDETKMNELVEARVKTRLAPVERDLRIAREQLGEKDGTINELTDKERKRTIRDAVRDAAKGAKVTDEAIDDALLLGDSVFEVSEDGKVVVKEGTAYPQGLEPSALFTDLQTKKPHWFGESRGGGGQGNRGGGTQMGNPFTAENWNLTEQGRIMNTDPQKAEQLARSAGHKDAASAIKPAPSK